MILLAHRTSCRVASSRMKRRGPGGRRPCRLVDFPLAIRPGSGVRGVPDEASTEVSQRAPEALA